MKKNYAFLALIFIFPLFVQAQTPPPLNTEAAKLLQKPAEEFTADTTKKSNWHIKNRLVITGEESYYANWTKDGFNAIGFTGIYLGKYNYLTLLNRWENTLDMAYGLTSQDLNGDGKLDPTPHPHKTDDRFILTSSYSRRAFSHWYYNGTVDFRSQFTQTYKDTLLQANAFAPAYLLTALGACYEINGFSALLSPISTRATFVTDNRLSQIGAFGVKPGDKSLFEFGAYMKFLYSKEVFKNVALDTKLEFFYDYTSTLFKDTYVNWEVVVNMKVNKYLSAFFNMQMIFDRKITSNLQFKEKLGLMVSWDF